MEYAGAGEKREGAHPCRAVNEFEGEPVIQVDAFPQHAKTQRLAGAIRYLNDIARVQLVKVPEDRGTAVGIKVAKDGGVADVSRASAAHVPGNIAPQMRRVQIRGFAHVDILDGGTNSQFWNGEHFGPAGWHEVDGPLGGCAGQ